MLKRALMCLVMVSFCSGFPSSQYLKPSKITRSAAPQPAENGGSQAAGPSASGQALTPVFTDPLTGLPTDEQSANCRPVAVSIDNHHMALPQSGIGQAAVYYEALAEGNITRIIAIFHHFNAPKIGPVRSVRPYFLDFAMDYDAILVHHGGSPQGYGLIEKSGIADLDAMRLSGVFWRDPARADIPGMSVHSSYTGEAQIRQAQEKYEFRPVIREGLNPGFSFYNEPTTPDGAAATYIYVPFAAEYGAAFQYRGGLYYKYMEETPQIDAETGEQLSASNVIIQYAPIDIIPGDKAGRREADLLGEGNGLMITRGRFIPIRWVKPWLESPTRWYNTDGSVLYFNRGKTWICVVSPETAISIE